MNKLILATAISLSALTATAADVSVSTVRDFSTDRNGVRVTTGVAGFNAGYTHVTDSYNRFSLGKEMQLVKLGKASVAATGTAVYQNSTNNANGYGLIAGVKAAYPLTKDLELVAGIERFIGQKRVNSYNGNTTVVGVNIKF